MPNHFLCNGERVAFTNGATELVYQHWLRLLEREPDQPGKRILGPVLEQYADLAASSAGISGMGMDRDAMPEALLDMRAAWTLMKLVRLTGEDVRSIEGIPREAWDETPPSWTCTRAEYFEERMGQFHRALAAWVVPP